jgi:hypothetical protein
MHDADPGVAKEAIGSARLLGDSDLLFVPTLISLMRNRRLKNAAREALVSYGENAIGALTYFLRDDEEDPWVRRHIPGTLARVPSPASVEALVEALESDDGFLRYKAVLALEKIRRENSELPIPFAPIEKLLLKEAARYYRYLGATASSPRLLRRSYRGRSAGSISSWASSTSGRTSARPASPSSAATPGGARAPSRSWTTRSRGSCERRSCP